MDDPRPPRSSPAGRGRDTATGYVVRLLRVESTGQEVDARSSFLRAWEPDVAPYGRVTVGTRPDEAIRFPTYADAVAFLHEVHGTFPDGRPSRPLRAFTALVLSYADAVLWASLSGGHAARRYLAAPEN